MFAKRKPKTLEPDDFIGKDLKQLMKAEARPAKTADWASYIEDAKAKGIKGPW